MIKAARNIRNIHRLFARRIAFGFQSRQRQQILDQRLHAFRLIAHQRHRSADQFRIRRFHVGNGFEKTADYGERRAQFVRYIGHKIAAHGFNTLAIRDVAADNQFAVFLVRHNQYRQHQITAVRTHGERIGVTVAKRFRKLRLPHQMRHQLPEVTFGIESEMPL